MDMYSMYNTEKKEHYNVLFYYVPKLYNSKSFVLQKIFFVQKKWLIFCHSYILQINYRY